MLDEIKQEGRIVRVQGNSTKRIRVCTFGLTDAVGSHIGEHSRYRGRKVKVR